MASTPLKWEDDILIPAAPQWAVDSIFIPCIIGWWVICRPCRLLGDEGTLASGEARSLTGHPPTLDLSRRAFARG
jgi:hypothetical protein